MTTAYKNLVFPEVVGGPGPYDVVALTITVTASDGSQTTPVKAQTDLTTYNAASALDKARHEAFSDIVMFFKQYASPVSIASDGNNVITLSFERQGMFADSALGKPGFFYSSGNRANAYKLGVAYVAANTKNVSAIAVTINGVSQTS